MAINKTINKSTKSHGAMRNCLEYILREAKTNSGLIYLTGPFSRPVINYDTVYQAFLEEKKLWYKDSGRMYAHNIISWHKDENITAEEAYEFGKAFVDKWFDGFQTVMAVHVDRNHVHLHMVTNSVSFLDGHKLHQTKKDLEAMKQLTNDMCQERGLTVAEKGKTFEGEPAAVGQVTAWSKDKYHMLLAKTKDSYIAKCAMAIVDSMKDCCSQDEFVGNMKKHGWLTHWKPTRKNITFEDAEGHKVRDRNITKTFNIEVGKEVLLNEFARNNELRERATDESDRELAAYYSQVQEAASGTVQGIEPEGQSDKISQGTVDTVERRDGEPGVLDRSVQKRLEVNREKVRERDQRQQASELPPKRRRGRSR